jgi:hypothetical protein
MFVSGKTFCVNKLLNASSKYHPKKSRPSLSGIGKVSVSPGTPHFVPFDE